MDAKKLTMAVSFLMVLAAAFVLVVPSESDDAAAFEITDAHFQQGTTGVYLYVTFSEVVNSGKMTLYLGDEVIKKVKVIPAGTTSISTKAADTLEDGTYTVVAETEKGTVSKDIIYPTPVEHTISVLASPVDGGQITADKTAAYYGDIVTLTIVPAEGYKLTKLTLNGQAIQGSTFEMPNNDVMVVAMFEPTIVYCDVQFVISGDMEPVTKKAVVGETLEELPEAPSIIGVQFVGWFTEDGEEFDFETTPVTESMTVYAHYGPEAPSTEQTEKFVAAMSDDCNLVLTAYDGNIIGKGTAKVTVYKMETVRGMNMYVAVGTFDADFESDGVYLVKDVSEDVGKIATAAGSYAVAAFVTLDNTTEQQTDYATFEINGQA